MAQLKDALSYATEVLKKHESSYSDLVDRFIEMIDKNEIESSDLYPTFTIRYQNSLLDKEPCFQLTYSIHWVEHTDIENDEVDLQTYSTSLNLIIYFSSSYSHTPSEIIRIQKTQSSLDEVTKQTIQQVRIGLKEVVANNQIDFKKYELTITHEN